MFTKLAFNGNIIDIEASGLSSDSYPVEIGIVLGSGETTYEVVIAPPPQWTHWCSTAEAQHGLTRHYIDNFGVDIRTVCEELNVICENQTLYSDCWIWDSQWINRLYRAAGMHPSFRCSPVEYFLSDEHLLEWNSYKSSYAKKLNLREHRALNDAKIIAGILDDEGMRFSDSENLESFRDKLNTLRKSA